MRRLLAIAVFLLASSTAQAQYTFEYGGHTIRIDPDRGTIPIPGVYDNTGSARRAKRPHGNQESGRSKQAPQEAKSDSTKSDYSKSDYSKSDSGSVPQASSPSSAPDDSAAAPAAAPSPPANTATTAPEPSTATENDAPALTAVTPMAPPPAPANPPPLRKESAPVPRSEPSPTVAAVPPPAASAPPQQRTPATAAPPLDPYSPIGVWLTEEKEGKVRIEQCGANLCGYSVDAKSNLNGEQVLINMRPGKDQKWSGRILDPTTGSTYDSTIALKGADSLRVQGCAFGGMFCGGQTWTRVN